MIQKIIKLWQRMICEYQVSRQIHPPVYPEAMLELLARRIDTNSIYKYIRAIQALSEGEDKS